MPEKPTPPTGRIIAAISHTGLAISRWTLTGMNGSDYGANGWTGGTNARLCVLSVRQGSEGLGIAGAASLAIVLSASLAIILFISDFSPT